MLENKRKYRSTIVYFQSKFEANEIWEYLVHPKHVINFTKEPCYYCDIPEDFTLEVGQSWTNIHTGEDCKGDIDQQVITKLEQGKLFTTISHQAGIKIKSRFKLIKNEKGTLISEEQIFSPSLENPSLLGVFTWLMLFTGILTRFSFKPDDDLFWFEKMENEIEKN